VHSSQSPLSWDCLVAALRDELQEKGGLIRLLNQQTDVLYRQDGAENRRLEELIKNQLEATVRCRQTRESSFRQTAHNLSLPEEARAQEVLARFPEYVQPLLEALFSEVERLSGRLDDRLRQNQLLKERFLAAAPP
jgi:hypothetical protein